VARVPYKESQVLPHIATLPLVAALLRALGHVCAAGAVALPPLSLH
jgi:hypothetical protein